MRKIQDLIQDAYGTAVSKGWHETKDDLPALLSLFHTEVMEADESVSISFFKLHITDEERANLSEELSDVLIRMFDLCGLHEIDLQAGLQSQTGFETLEEIYANRDARFHDQSITLLSLLLLNLHNKIAKVTQAYRKHQDVVAPLADVFLHVLDIAKNYELPIVYSVYTKMEKNKERTYKHGGCKI